MKLSQVATSAGLRKIGPAPQVRAPKSRRDHFGSFTPRYEIS
jgi:hypothetical protein